MPVLLPALLASTAITTIGQSISSAISTKAMGEAQKATFETNARMAKLQAEDAIKRGDKAAALHAQKVKKLIGAQRAAYAGQGVDISIGSPLDIQEETAELGALDVLTIRNNAYREAWGYRAQALDYTTQGKFASLEAKARARNTLLTGGLNTLNLGVQAAYAFGGSSGGSGGSSGSGGRGDISSVPSIYSPDLSYEGFGYGGGF